MRLVRKEEKDYRGDVTSFSEVSDAGGTLRTILYGGREPSLFKQVLTLIL